MTTATASRYQKPIRRGRTRRVSPIASTASSRVPGGCEDGGVGGWSVVVPVKPLAAAKTRLRSPRRAALVLAMALDTVTAARRARGVRRVIVVSDDPAVAGAVRAAGCLCLPDVPASGLNSALGYGAGIARARHPGDGVVALSADLPALRAAELAAALSAVPRRGAGVVADATGSGTTFYAARRGVAFEPLFGVDSMARHLAAGARALEGQGLDGLRRDVDTVADLWAAAGLGLGEHTRAVLDSVPALG